MENQYFSLMFNLVWIVAIWSIISGFLLFGRLRKLEKNRGNVIGDLAFWGNIEVLIAIFHNKYKKDKQFTKYVWSIRISLIVFLVLIALIFLLFGQTSL